MKTLIAIFVTTLCVEVSGQTFDNPFPAIPLEVIAPVSGPVPLVQPAPPVVQSLKTVIIFNDGVYNSQRRRSDWSWPGELRRHLQQPPHNLSSGQVGRMTARQCIDWHNASHTGRVQPIRRPQQLCPT